jgi:hypothetical protein
MYVTQRVSESLSAAGVATAPGANGILTGATITTPPQGTYLVRANCFYVAGTPAAADDNNIQIREGSTLIARVAMPRAINVMGVAQAYVTVDGATSITLNAIGAATAGVVYSGVIIAERAGSF